MGLYVNPNEALLKMSMNSPIYVDKSMLIAELNHLINSDKRFLCVSRARRFGKTMAGSMIAAYYSKGANSRPLFEKLKIGQDPSFEQYLNKFNVIKLDINATYSNSNHDEDIVPLFSKAVCEEIMDEYPDIGIKENDSLARCIQRVYTKTGLQTVIIMDEYDVLIREKAPEKVFKPYLQFLNGLFKDSVLAPAIAMAYLTGIFPIVRDKIQSKLNLFDEYTMLDSLQLTPYIGFTQDEVETLCKEHNMDFEECQRWYNGYHIRGESLYNSNSVVKAMMGQRFGSYWGQTGSYEAISLYIKLNFEGLRDDIIALMAGETREVQIHSFLNTLTDFKNKDDVLTYLIHLGYLAYNQDTEECYIPNGEIRTQWDLAIRDNTDYASVVKLIKDSKYLLQATMDGDSEAVAKALEIAHEELMSKQRYNHEACFQSAIRLAYFYATSKYTIISELPAGKGYADVVFLPYVPNVPAMIVELKLNSSAGAALEQIKNRQYFNVLDKYQGDLLLVGINYDKEAKSHSCTIEKFVK